MNRSLWKIYINNLKSNCKMEATIQYTTDFFDNLSIFQKRPVEPEPVIVQPQLQEPDSNDLLSDHSRIPSSPYSQLPYTRTERAAIESNGIGEDIKSIEAEIAAKRAQQQAMMAAEQAKMEKFSELTNQMLGNMRNTEVPTVVDVCADFRQKLIDCYNGGEHCEFHLKNWKDCEANRK